MFEAFKMRICMGVGGYRLSIRVLAIDNCTLYERFFGVVGFCIEKRT